ncbi:YceI family protein [Hanstruepera marina]|uniref:YceI family protein n=1 Tax=Hanstruepera marina TaxID=2873265 RepID=UPI001CA784B7|nr:YceI family protein [Hanstruepera marina]
MRTIKQNRMMRLFTILIVIFTSQNVLAQQFNLNNGKSSMSIFGTSSLHDWEETVEEQSGTIKLNTEGQISITALNISIVAESIKSGKSAMDKNTYKALDTKNHKYITFKMYESKKIIDLGNSEYQVIVSGKLSVSGVTKTVDLSFKMKVTADTVTLEGEKTFNMKDYGIEPPKALLGTITTGEDVTIKFKSILTN